MIQPKARCADTARITYRGCPSLVTCYRNISNKFTWIMCPICGAKTRAELHPDTELRNFPLFCLKCKQEFVIDAKRQQLTVVTEK